jgi:hypothetical protein
MTKYYLILLLILIVGLIQYNTIKEYFVPASFHSNITDVSRFFSINKNRNVAQYFPRSRVIVNDYITSPLTI